MRRGAHTPIFNKRTAYGSVRPGTLIGTPWTPPVDPPPLLDTVFMAPSNLVAVGDYLYVTSPSDGVFYAIDKSNPASLGTPSGFGTVSQRAISTLGSHVFVVGGGEFRSWDVSTPATPSLAGSTSTGGAITNAPGMVASGGRVYVATGLSAGVRLRNINVSTPASPSQTSSLSNSALNGVVGLAFSGSHVFAAATAANQLTAVNISVPASMTIADTEANADLAGVIDVQLNLTYAYCCAPAGLIVVDKSTPTALAYATTVSIPNAVAIEVGGDHAYVLTDDGIGNGALHIVDISTPAAPVDIPAATVTGLLGAPRDLVWDDDVLFVTDEGNGAVYAFDVAAYP